MPPDDAAPAPTRPSIIELSPEDARRMRARAGRPRTEHKADKLLQVRGLSTHFFTPDGVVQAVDDVTLRRRLRRDARPRRRVRLRQERHRPVRRPAGPEPARADRGRRDPVRRDQPPQAQRRGDAQAAGQGDRVHLPGPADQPQSDADHRLPDRRDDPRAPGPAAEGRARSASSSCSPRSASRGRRSA